MKLKARFDFPQGKVTAKKPAKGVKAKAAEATKKGKRGKATVIESSSDDESDSELLSKKPVVAKKTAASKVRALMRN